MPPKIVTLKTLVISNIDKDMAVSLENNWENYLTVSSKVEYMHILWPNNLPLDVCLKEMCVFVYQKICKIMFIKTFLFITELEKKWNDYQSAVERHLPLYLFNRIHGNKTKNRTDESHKHNERKSQIFSSPPKSMYFVISYITFKNKQN